MYLPQKFDRPTLPERYQLMTVGLSELNRYIDLLTAAYRRNHDEGIQVVVEGLLKAKEMALAELWARENTWREQDEREAFLYFSELPFSVQVYLMSEELR
jgi:hypothetical protein